MKVASGNVTTGSLDMVDSKGDSASVFEVYSGQKIKWKIGKDSNVLAITKMFEKTGSHNVFRKRPHKKFLSSTWKGRVEKTDVPDEEYYYMEWKDKQNNYHNYDPKI